MANAGRLSRPIPRREFLRISSTAVVGIAATSLVESTRLFATTTSVSQPLLSIGFASHIPAPGASSRLGFASGLLTSDPAFLARGARVTIAGFGRSAKHLDDPAGIQFNAVFPVLSRTPNNYPRFAAWSYAGRGDTAMEAGPVSFTMPVTAANGLQFLVNRIRPTGQRPADPTKPPALGPEQSLASLAINSGDVKLQRGVYVFAFREGGDDTAPQWSSYSVANRTGFLTVPNLALSYAVVTIDYEK